MSSSISADYSPTSNYSYPSEQSQHSPASPHSPSRPRADQVHPPRLSSPNIFRDIFASETAGQSNRSPLQLPPLHEINFAETMQDVNRALQSANRAIQTAQEAFQSRRTTSAPMGNAQEVVDLTNSPPSPSRDDRSFDSFLYRTLHPHDSRTGSRMTNHSLNQPYYPRSGPSTHHQSLFVEEDDPTSRYAGQTDSLAGSRRRFEEQQRNLRRSYMTIPNMERTLVRSSLQDVQRREEEEAIRRQRIAREQWEQSQQRQQRQQQRNRLQQQRSRIMASAGQSDRLQGQMQQTPNQHIPSQSPLGVTLDLHSSPQRPNSSDSSLSSSSVEAVDLTAVNDGNDLAAALIHSQSNNPTANPAQSSTEPRSALTAYKCPICLESPRNATSTICGHLFCHECILETLKNSENVRREDAPPHRKVKGQCPVCRKELARKDEEGATRTLVPLEIKLISKKKMEELRRQERKRQRESEKKSKGKEKEKLDGHDNKETFELSSDDEDDWGISGSSQKENKAKRVKLSASEELDQELFGAFLNVDQA